MVTGKGSTRPGSPPRDSLGNAGVGASQGEAGRELRQGEEIEGLELGRERWCSCTSKGNLCRKAQIKRSLEEEKEEKHSNRSEGNSEVWNVFKTVGHEIKNTDKNWKIGEMKTLMMVRQ